MRILDHLPPALTKPRFRIFTVGQVVSILGSWTQQVALSWLIYRLSGSVLLLGVAGFMLQIPHLLLAPFAGLAADRLPRLRTLVAINSAQCLLATTLAVLALSGVSSVGTYLTIALFLGVTSAFEAPVRQSLLLTIVEERALLPSAIAMNSVIFNTGRMIGPAIAGLLLTVVTEGWCFALNALSFVAIVAALIAMRLPDPWPTTALRPGLAGLAEAARHLAGVPAARLLLPVIVVVGFFGSPYHQLMPSLAVEFFGGNASTLGTLMTAVGTGALITATVLSFQRGVRVQLMLTRVAPIVLGLALIGLALSRSYGLTVLLLAVIGGSMLATAGSTNTLLQQSVEDHWRGRVIGFYIMAFIGAAPLGHLTAGWVASQIGLTETLMLNGAIVVIIAGLAQFRLLLRPKLLEELRASLTRVQH